MNRDELLLSRRHEIHQGRAAQLKRNHAVMHGGKPYVDIALTRFPHEDNLSWLGSQALGVVGRKDRAFLVNYAKRIVNKQNQYVFAEDVERDGLDDAFAADVSITGTPVGTFMEDVSSALTAGGWCWLHVDRGGPETDPATGKPVARSVLEREQAGDRVFWSLWRPDEVVDWRFDKNGQLLWLLSEFEEYDNENPFTEATTRRIRELWERGQVTRFVIKDGKIQSESVTPFPFKGVPFFPAGTASVLPYWFDDVERIQASLLNLESAHDENLIQSVYPQLVIPQDAIENTMLLADLEGPSGYEKAVELVRGLNNPIQEPSESRYVTRYLQPRAQDLKAIPDEILRRRKELYQVVGMGMNNPESRQVASAEAKAWDNLDPSAAIAERARVLDDVERKLVSMSAKIDSGFKVYEPRYPVKFDIPDVAADMAALIQLDNFELPEIARREIRRAAMKVLNQVVSIPKDRMAAIVQALDEWAPDDDLPMPG